MLGNWVEGLIAWGRFDLFVNADVHYLNPLILLLMPYMLWRKDLGSVRCRTVDPNQYVLTYKPLIITIEDHIYCTLYLRIHSLLY